MLSSTGEMHVNGFQIAFDTYNSTISWLREKCKKKESERYDIERGYPPWYDAHVYKKLKSNLQKDLNSQTDGPIKPKDTDTATTNPKDLVNITRKYVVWRLRLIEILTQKHGPGNINSQITVKVYISWYL